jgi:hypothetical protein
MNRFSFASRKVLSAIAFGLFLVTNPAYLIGCGNGEDVEEGFSFGEEEMRALVQELQEEAWLIDGYWVQFSFEAAAPAPEARLRPSAIGMAHACENRTFVASAGACGDSTEMALVGTLTLVDDELGTSSEFPLTDAVMYVSGRELRWAEFNFELETGGARVIWTREDDPAFELLRLQIEEEQISIDHQ